MTLTSPFLVVYATTIEKYIPLTYSEYVTLPSICWKIADKNGAISEAIPAPLLTQFIENMGVYQLSNILDQY